MDNNYKGDEPKYIAKELAELNYQLINAKTKIEQLEAELSIRISTKEELKIRKQNQKLREDCDDYKESANIMLRDRDKWKNLYEDLHKLHAEGKLDKSDELLRENQRLRDAIQWAIDEINSVDCDVCAMENFLQKALEE
jgi:hypothetical protein